LRESIIVQNHLALPLMFGIVSVPFRFEGLSPPAALRYVFQDIAQLDFVLLTIPISRVSVTLEESPDCRGSWLPPFEGVQCSLFPL